MMRYLSVAIVFILGLSSCKKTGGYKVSVDASDIGTQQITVVCTAADGNRRVLSMPAVDGKFEFSGQAPTVSVVEIFTSNKQLYAALLVQDGESVSLKSDGTEKQVSGSTRSQQLMAYQSGDDIGLLPEEVRDAVRLVYAENLPADSLRFVAPELIMGRDSVMTFDVEGVWVFTSSVNDRTGMVLDTLRAYASREERPLRDVFISGDTVAWRLAVRGDSATWTQGMMPDAPLVYRGVLRWVPSLIEVDSAGAIVRNQRLE